MSSVDLMESERDGKRMPVLAVTGLSVGYCTGGSMAEQQGIKSLFGFGRRFFPVLREMSFSINFQRKPVAIIGPNGAGKTTLLRAISGAVPSSGTIIWSGQNLQDLTTYERADVGVTFVPHGGGGFPSLSIKEHLKLAWGPKVQTEIVIDELCARVRAKAPGLERKLDFLRKRDMVGNHSGGEQKILSLVRLLFRQWSLVLLDEPTAGLSPSLLETYMVLLEMLQPACVLKVEQYARASIAKRCGATLYELREDCLQRFEEA